jgi:hypothetical protein
MRRWIERLGLIVLGIALCTIACPPRVIVQHELCPPAKQCPPCPPMPCPRVEPRPIAHL